MDKIKIVCFGEVLWDIFPNGQRRIGGAPFNVAYHLFKMGIDVSMISAVGRDVLGEEILSQLNSWGISNRNIQISNSYPTSTVIASLDENNDAHYDILEDVAWDFLEINSEDKKMLKGVDAFVFGTLAARSIQSRKTLFELVEASRFNVFDINLRAPHYDVRMIKDLLFKTQLAKFNQEELRIMLAFLEKPYEDEKAAIHYLQDTFGMQEIIVSKGSKGALYANKDDFYLYPPVRVEVKDTVGSGDSFLAGFLSKRFDNNASADQIMQHAVVLAAYITSQEGACPDYAYDEFKRFKNFHQVSAMPF